MRISPMNTTMTVDPRERILARLRREPEFAMAMVGEAIELITEGYAEEARSVLRTLANAVGFEELARATGTHAKTLHRQLSPAGNPTMNAVALILHALMTQLSPKPVRMTVRFEEAEAA